MQFLSIIHLSEGKESPNFVLPKKESPQSQALQKIEGWISRTQSWRKLTCIKTPWILPVMNWEAIQDGIRWIMWIVGSVLLLTLLIAHSYRFLKWLFSPILTIERHLQWGERQSFFKERTGFRQLRSWVRSSRSHRNSSHLHHSNRSDHRSRDRRSFARRKTRRRPVREMQTVLIS